MKTGEIIKEAREKAGYTQATLAEKTGITQAAISHFEKDIRRPTPANIKKIAELLGIEESAFNTEETVQVLLRSIKGMNDNEIQEVTNYVNFLKFNKGEKN